MLAWSFPFALSAALIASPLALVGYHEAGGVEARAVVGRQLDAFRKGDAEAAYGLTSPALRESSRSAGVFMETVRTHHAALLHQRSADFGSLAILGDEAAQNLYLVDDEGGVWAVIYVLARQPDGRWAVDDYLVINSDSTDPSSRGSDGSQNSFSPAGIHRNSEGAAETPPVLTKEGDY